MLNNFFSKESAESLLSKDDTLAVLEFGSEAITPATPIVINNLDVEKKIVEVWKTPNQKVTRGQTGECQWSCSEDYFFVSLVVPFDDSENLEIVSQVAYENLLNTIQNSGFPQLMRLWNILPNINVGDGNSENYRLFCTGRLNAFSKFGISDEQFPAASAVGHFGSVLTLYGLSTKRYPKNIANPRQVNAFKYPSQYGPSSPSFARATSLSYSDDAQHDYCFISGTASILGHETVHVNNLQGQLHTTNDNILYLLQEVGLKRRNIKTSRVYIRHPEHFEEIKNTVSAWYPNSDIVYTHADICRSDLLVEIECFCESD